MTNPLNIGYEQLGNLPDEEAVELLEQFGQVPDWVERVYIARFRKMRSDLWERAYRILSKRNSLEANSTRHPKSYHHYR